ncbi:histidinol-phosphate transaminase [Stecheria intestinalis]|uniref:histidinol-phosphate transaminase n=1 Tax=Stecheria intestinalis TaxID=2606630 RepID=UPI0023F3BF37|nr:histidinol-phosphate transaminase [Stecheria intestinalis]MDD5882392.1 histidinol-phosphate transaminase [Stecheria intestinalis]
MSEYLNQRYRNLSPYTPGEQPLDKDYIKLNTNENPYPPGSGVLKVINEAAVKDLRLYEDPDNRLVIRTLAEHYGVKPSQVCVTCGSDETLDLAIMAFGEDGFAFPDLTYNFYKVFCQLHHTDMQVIPLKDDFTIDVKDYLGLGKGVILANPNAPTGLVLPREKIEEILKADPHHVVVVDEAYIDFNEGGSMIPYVNKYPNLLVVQTFSKARSLAGARVGYGIGSEALISDLERIRNSMNPYGLSRLSQQAAIAAVQEQEYYDENCRKVIATRTWFIQELEKLGFSVLPSHTNFVLAHSDQIPGEVLYQKLKDHGVLVRHFSDPRIADAVRISIGTDEDMHQAAEKIREVLAEWNASQK